MPQSIYNLSSRNICYINYANTGVNSGPISITNIAGLGFVTGSTVQLTKTGQNAVNASAINVINPGQISCAFNLSGLTTGYWNVVVSTCGTGSISATLSNGFLVNSAPTQYGTITGKVTAMNGVTALCGAIISTLQNGTTIASCVSDAAGIYSLQANAGTYSLAASSTGYITQIKAGQTITTGAVTTVNFTLATPDTRTGSSSLDNAHPYPSYANLSRGDKINFAGITPNAELRILTLAGHILKILKADENGIVPAWDGTAESGGKVGSGTYIFHVSDNKGNVKVFKVLLVK